MTMALRIILFSFIALLIFSELRADLLSEVPQDSRDELAQGQLSIISQNVDGVPWPRLKLYQVVNAPPKVVADLFSDYSAAPNYIPGMLGAKVIATNPDGTKDVQYTVKVPVLQRISYTVRNTYIQKGNSYEVKWILLQSPLAKSSDGSLRIEPYGKGKTLMCYTNLCVPFTNLVAGLKNQALNEAKSTVRAIKAEAERRAGREA
jgi:ribosome-associated toxin RatA of RatAB toxin-antitoxin module